MRRALWSIMVGLGVICMCICAPVVLVYVLGEHAQKRHAAWFFASSSTDTFTPIGSVIVCVAVVEVVSAAMWMLRP